MSESPCVTLMKIGEVGERVGLSRPAIYALMKKGRFPLPCYPAPRAPRWRSDEIDAHIERLSAERNAQATAA